MKKLVKMHQAKIKSDKHHEVMLNESIFKIGNNGNRSALFCILEVLVL